MEALFSLLWLFFLFSMVRKALGKTASKGKKPSSRNASPQVERPLPSNAHLRMKRSALPSAQKPAAPAPVVSRTPEEGECDDHPSMQEHLRQSRPVRPSGSLPPDSPEGKGNATAPPRLQPQPLRETKEPDPYAQETSAERLEWNADAVVQGFIFSEILNRNAGPRARFGGRR